MDVSTCGVLESNMDGCKNLHCVEADQMGVYVKLLLGNEKSRDHQHV